MFLFVDQKFYKKLEKQVSAVNPTYTENCNLEKNAWSDY